jgi:hypothetical protein
VRGNIKSFEKSFTHAEVVALAERTLKRFKGDKNAAGRYARSMESRYESSKWAQVVEVLATSRSHHATMKASVPRKSPQQLAREIDDYLQAVGNKAITGLAARTPKERMRGLLTKFNAIKQAANMDDLRKRFKITPAMEKRMEKMAEKGSLLDEDVRSRQRRLRRPR